jgi:hypothetical protein
MVTMKTIVHLPAELIALLQRGLSPMTDNRKALQALGFQRSYPQAVKGYDSTIWERAIDYGRSHDGQRIMAIERAFLVRDRLGLSG